MKDSPPNTRKALVATLVLLLLVGIYRSVPLILADYHDYISLSYQQKWAKQGAIASVDEWKQGFHHAARAVAIDDTSPAVMERLGRMYEWYGYAKGNTPLVAQTNNSHALHLYLKAAALRPTRPNVWADIVLLKAKQHQFDSQANNAVQHAYSLGQHDREVQRKLFQALVMEWDNWSTSSQQIGRELFSLMQKTTGKRFSINLVKQHQREAEFAL